MLDMVHIHLQRKKEMKKKQTYMMIMIIIVRGGGGGGWGQEMFVWDERECCVRNVDVSIYELYTYI